MVEVRRHVHREAVHRRPAPDAHAHRHFKTGPVAPEGDEITAEACFHLYRTRLNSEVDNWVGRRIDVLRRHDGSFRLARRHIFLDQTVILSTNMSTIF